MNNDGCKKRINLARRRTLDLYKYVGAVSTHFAGLELQIIDLLAKCINPNNPDRAKTALSQLSFRQCVNTFRDTIPKLFPKAEIISQVKELSKLLNEVSLKRNEFIHSSWIAYSTGNYGQQRARSKGNLSQSHKIHSENPKKSMQQLVDEIEKLVFDLICLENQLREENSE